MTTRKLPETDIPSFLEFVDSLRGKEYANHDVSTITKLFNWHNKIFVMNMEHSKSCGGCRTRVWARLKNYADGIINNTELTENETLIWDKKKIHEFEKYPYVDENLIPKDYNHAKDLCDQVEWYRYFSLEQIPEPQIRKFVIAHNILFPNHTIANSATPNKLWHVLNRLKKYADDYNISQQAMEMYHSDNEETSKIIKQYWKDSGLTEDVTTQTETNFKKFIGLVKSYMIDNPLVVKSILET